MTAHTDLTVEAKPVGAPITLQRAALQQDEGWNVTSVPALSDAEDLLDALEMNGFSERELIVLGNSTFAVRWR